MIKTRMHFLTKEGRYACNGAVRTIAAHSTRDRMAVSCYNCQRQFCKLRALREKLEQEEKRLS